MICLSAKWQWNVERSRLMPRTESTQTVYSTLLTLHYHSKFLQIVDNFLRFILPHEAIIDMQNDELAGRNVLPQKCRTNRAINPTAGEKLEFRENTLIASSRDKPAPKLTKTF